MKLYKIYKYTNLITGMSYVGKTYRTLEQRAEQGMKGYRGCEKFWEAIQYYGTDCWRDEILWDGLTSDEANIYEQVEIQDNGTIYPYGYNQTFGGDGCNASDETCRRISESVSKTFLESPEIWRVAQQKATEAAAKHNTGKSLSKEHKQAISNGNKGKKRSKPIHNRSAIWDNVEEVIRLYTVELKTTTEIALMYGLAPSSGSSVRDLLKANGVKLSRSRKPTRCDIWGRQSEVVSLYTQEFKSTKEIADMFGVSTPTVLKVLRSNRVELISTRKVAAWRHQDEIINLYTVEMKNITEIATIFKTSSDVVSRILKSNGIPTRKMENQNHHCYGKPAHNRSDMWNHVDEVIKLYTMEFKTSREIGEIFGVNGSVVLKLLKANGVDTSPKRHTIYDHVKEVVRFYTVDMKTMREIADIFGVERHLVSKLLKANGVKIDKSRRSRPWKHHPERSDVQNIFTTLPLEMSLPEKRSFLHANFSNINKSTLNKWIREWSNVTGCQPRHPNYPDVNDFFLSLPSALSLKEKRRITRKQFPDVKDFTINTWTRQWQSELETHNYVQAEFQFS